MKRALSVLCIAVLVLSLLCLTGCGIDGTYKMTKAYGGDQSINAAEQGMSAELKISGSSATYTASYGGQSGAQNWSVDTKAKTMTDGDGNVWNYQLSGKKLTISRTVSEGTITIEFAKTS